MLKLYGGARSRASIIHWYLEELSVPYEFILLDMQNGEHLQADYRKINPTGKVPGIVDGDFKLWESGAILVYLAQKYGNLSADPEKIAIANQWVLFANATLGPTLLTEASREKEAPRFMQPLEDLLSEHEFLLGNTFSVVDVAVGAILCYIPMMFPMDLSSFPHVLAYIKKLSERPAFQATIGKRTAS